MFELIVVTILVAGFLLAHKLCPGFTSKNPNKIAFLIGYCLTWAIVIYSIIVKNESANVLLDLRVHGSAIAVGLFFVLIAKCY
jgi:hypothetical protein